VQQAPKLHRQQQQGQEVLLLSPLYGTSEQAMLGLLTTDTLAAAALISGPSFLISNHILV
jgi:hypothetical protein